jgi:hypothetical protein
VLSIFNEDCPRNPESVIVMMPPPFQEPVSKIPVCVVGAVGQQGLERVGQWLSASSSRQGSGVLWPGWALEMAQEVKKSTCAECSLVRGFSSPGSGVL